MLTIPFISQLATPLAVGVASYVLTKRMFIKHFVSQLADPLTVGLCKSLLAN